MTIACINTSLVIDQFGFMNCRTSQYTINKRVIATFILVTFSLILSITFSGLTNVYSVQIFSKDEKPFGISYDDLAAKFWNYWIGKNSDQATPKQDGCLLVNS